MDGKQIQKSENNGKTTNYVYDGHNRLISEETGGKAKTYTYDGRGNRTRVETYDTVINYTYDKNNRLVNEEVEEDGERYWYRNYTYSYDKNGNRLTKKLNGSKTLETNTYNGYNQLISRTENGKTNTYTYDIGGLRKSKTVNGVTTKQVWSMGELAMEINGGTDTVKAKYYHGITPIGMRTSGGQLYYTTSYNGTVEKVTNLGGGVVADYTYDAFGNQTDSIADEIYNPFRYCGEYYDEESGLIYLRNRYYDPSIGAFINEDPIRDGLNWYVYCENDPVNRIDPDGEDSYVYYDPTMKAGQKGYMTKDEAEYYKKISEDIFGTTTHLVSVENAGEFKDYWNNNMGKGENGNNVKIDAIYILLHGSATGEKDSGVGFMYFQDGSRIAAKDFAVRDWKKDTTVACLDKKDFDALYFSVCNSANPDIYNLTYAFMQQMNIQYTVVGWDGGTIFDYSDYTLKGGGFRSNQHTFNKYNTSGRERYGKRVFDLKNDKWVENVSLRTFPGRR